MFARPPTQVFAWILLGLFTVSDLRGQEPSSSRRLVPALIGGVLGSAAGVGVGHKFGSMLTAGCSRDDCDVGGGFGAALGGWLGGATGAYIGSRKGGGSPSFGRALLGSTVGILGAGLGSFLVAELSGPTGHEALYFVGVTVGHGTVAGLITGLAP